MLLSSSCHAQKERARTHSLTKTWEKKPLRIYWWGEEGKSQLEKIGGGFIVWLFMFCLVHLIVNSSMKCANIYVSLDLRAKRASMRDGEKAQCGQKERRTVSLKSKYKVFEVSHMKIYCYVCLVAAFMTGDWCRYIIHQIGMILFAAANFHTSYIEFQNFTLTNFLITNERNAFSPIFNGP